MEKVLIATVYFVPKHKEHFFNQKGKKKKKKE